MDVAVQHRDRTEMLHIRQSLLTVISAPAPLGIDGPQRNVRKQHNWSAGGTALEVVLKPLQLFVAERPHPSSFQIGHVYETDEMHTFVIKAVPPGAFCTLPIALEILLAVVREHVVL